MSAKQLDPSWDGLADDLRRLAVGELDALTIKRQHAHLLHAFAANLLDVAAARQDHDCPRLDQQQSPPECSLSANGRDCLCSYASEAMLAEASRLRDARDAPPPNTVHMIDGTPIAEGFLQEGLERAGKPISAAQPNDPALLQPLNLATPEAQRAFSLKEGDASQPADEPEPVALVYAAPPAPAPMTQNTIGTDGSEDDAAFVERMAYFQTSSVFDHVGDEAKARLIALARLGAGRASDANVPRDGRREGMLRAAEIVLEADEHYDWIAGRIRAEADAIPADAGGVTEADLDIDAFSTTGFVNTSPTSVRIRHRPTGIVVTSDQARSQHQNRAIALRMLRTALAARSPVR